MSNVAQEIIVKKSAAGKVVGYIFILFLIGVGLLLFFVSWKVGALIALVGPVLFFFMHRKESKGRALLLKISPDGLWTPKHGYKPWSDVKNIRFKYDGNRRSHIEIYRGNPLYPDEVIEIGIMNMLSFRLRRELRKYTAID